MQTTLVILKPDTIERSLIGKIIEKLENKGLKIVGLKMTKLDDKIISEHYAHLVDKPFFPNIKAYMQRTPVVVLAIKGENAVLAMRNFIGVTNPLEALPGTIRGDFALTMDANIIHTSDSPENAEIELDRFFEKSEIFEY